MAASLFIAMVWIPFKTGLIEQASFEDSIMRIFNKKTAEYHPKDPLIKSENKSVAVLDLSTQLEQANKHIAWSFLEENELEENTPESILIRHEIKAVEAIPVEKYSIGPFHVVGGCFEFKENAETLVNRLRKKGYSAVLVGKRHDLYVVSYGSFSKKNAALDLLKEVKRKENSQAWLLRN